MHIPDGFISPQTFIPACAGAVAFWAHALRRVRRSLRDDTIPFVAVVTALAFVLMSITLPLPGGTSAHATLVAPLAILFGVWTGSSRSPWCWFSRP